MQGKGSSQPLRSATEGGSFSPPGELRQRTSESADVRKARLQRESRHGAAWSLSWAGVPTRRRRETLARCWCLRCFGACLILPAWLDDLTGDAEGGRWKRGGGGDERKLFAVDVATFCSQARDVAELNRTLDGCRCYEVSRSSELSAGLPKCEHVVRVKAQAVRRPDG